MPLLPGACERVHPSQHQFIGDIAGHTIRMVGKCVADRRCRIVPLSTKWTEVRRPIGRRMLLSHIPCDCFHCGGSDTQAMGRPSLRIEVPRIRKNLSFVGEICGRLGGSVTGKTAKLPE
jgi:hypothetical protein